VSNRRFKYHLMDENGRLVVKDLCELLNRFERSGVALGFSRFQSPPVTSP
jgi:hypothetical protein